MVDGSRQASFEGFIYLLEAYLLNESCMDDRLCSFVCLPLLSTLKYFVSFWRRSSGVSKNPFAVAHTVFVLFLFHVP